jgi:hypothetical protein
LNVHKYIACDAGLWKKVLVNNYNDFKKANAFKQVGWLHEFFSAEPRLVASWLANGCLMSPVSRRGDFG